MDQAEGDLEHAKSDRERNYFDWACFSASAGRRESGEGGLSENGAEAWGHSVADLLAELAQSYPVPRELMDAAMELDKAYIPTPYPNAHPSGSPRRRYTHSEAERMVAHAEQIVRFCEDLLSTLQS